MRGFRLTFISLGGSFAILSKCCRSGENKMRTQSGDLHRSWVLDVAREGQTANGKRPKPSLKIVLRRVPCQHLHAVCTGTPSPSKPAQAAFPQGGGRWSLSWPPLQLTFAGHVGPACRRGGRPAPRDAGREGERGRIPHRTLSWGRPGVNTPVGALASLA